jgi:diguanylate cyclase (GGDEF)-like protein
MPHVKNILLISNSLEQQNIFALFAKNFAIAITVIADDEMVTQKYLQQNNFEILVIDTAIYAKSLELYGLVDLVHEWQKSLPIIFLLEDENDHEISKLLNKGVQDYLIKPYMLKNQDNHEIIRRTMRHAVQRKRYEDKIAHLTKQDHLTGLIGGDLIPSSLRQAINSAKREKNLVALYFIDLDHFKTINDMYGHAVGNSLLIEIASRLQGIIKEDSILARLSADIFVIIDIADDIDACAVMAEEIISTLKTKINVANIELDISASIGVAIFPECGINENDLLQNAEISLIEAKRHGGGHYRFYSHELNKEATWKIHITSALKEVISDDSFSLHYQPKILLSTGEVTGVEALIRWQHPIYGSVRPDQFIPLAEEAGLIANVTAWVAETACKQHQHASFGSLTMAINISARELCSDGVVGLLEYILSKNHMNPSMLILEITETAMMTDSVKALSNMHALKEIGVKLDIDDFGTGYSSIDYLRRYPVDALKIDRSFIMHMHQQRDDARVVKLMVDIAVELGLEVVAEGVELVQQADMLRSLNCTQAQGYYFGKPMPATTFIEWLDNYNNSCNKLDNKL